MKGSKYLWLCLGLSLFFFEDTIKAQKLDYYDDVYPVVKSQPKEISYPLLFKFQKQIPYHPNCYFQMGLIFRQWTFEYDPFLDYDIVKYFAQQAETYFKLSAHYVDKKEARKNGEHYPGVKKQDNNWFYKPIDIKTVANNHVEEIQNYKTHFIKQREYLTKSINNYDCCIRIFRSINSNYNKIKDIYLEADENFMKKFDTILTSFDSTIFYFKKYREALDKYQIKDYDQHYSLKTVNTYHLQGLTNANFLSNDIKLWDFKSWIQNVKQVIRRNIPEFRKVIYATDKEMDSVLSVAKQGPLSDNYEFDKRKGYFISKFDYQSVILDFFRLKSLMIQLLNYSHHSLNNADFLLIGDYHKRKSQYFIQLKGYKNRLDSVYNQLMSKVNKDQLEKYKGFINNKYGNKEKFEEYLKSNKQYVDKQFQNSQQNFLLSLLKKENHVLDKNLDGYQVFEIKNQKDYTYLAGLTEENYSNGKVFLAKMDSGFQKIWLQKLKGISTGNNEIKSITLDVGERQITLMLSFIGKNKTQASNMIYRFGKDGNRYSKNRLQQKGVSKFVRYNELNQTYMIVLAESVAAHMQGLDRINILKMNSKMDSVYWKNELLLSGRFVDVVKIGIQNFVFCNYMKYKNKDGNIIKAQDENFPTDFFLAMLNAKGKVRRIIDYKAHEPCFLLNAEKLNSRQINLQGITGKYDNVDKIKIKRNQQHLYNSLLNFQGEVLLKSER